MSAQESAQRATDARNEERDDFDEVIEQTRTSALETLDEVIDVERRLSDLKLDVARDAVAETVPDARNDTPLYRVERARGVWAQVAPAHRPWIVLRYIGAGFWQPVTSGARTYEEALRDALRKAYPGCSATLPPCAECRDGHA